MNCLYLDSETKICKMQTLYSSSTYKPTQKDLELLCTSDKFHRCQRLRTYHARLKASVSEKDTTLLVQPELLPRSMLLGRTRKLIRALSPREEYQTDFAYYVNRLLLDSLRSGYRRNFNTEISLSRMNFSGGGQAVRTDLIWEYEICNITQRETDFIVPLRISTHSFSEGSLPIQEHIVLREATARITDAGDPINLIRKFQLDSVKVVQVSPARVKLDIGTRVCVKIPPNESAKIHSKFMYVNRCQDNHIQRMLALTRNFKLKVNYEEKDFMIDVDGFCLPNLRQEVKGHVYSWEGWLFAHHGVFIDWIDLRIVPRGMEEIRALYGIPNSKNHLEL